eukprot:m.176544 g.176544  ORF g.176544 m.176544 type:complete len:554 (-) comp31849_c6_seq3:33-1694(-)
MQLVRTVRDASYGDVSTRTCRPTYPSTTSIMIHVLGVLSFVLVAAVDHNTLGETVSRPDLTLASTPTSLAARDVDRVSHNVGHPPMIGLSADLDWNIKDLGVLDGAKTFFHPTQTFTDGSIIAARLAGATHGVSDLRNLYYDTGKFRRADATMLSDVSQFVSNLYVNVSTTFPKALLNLSGGPVVVSSVMRSALYAAEALHAPLLSGQTIAFADTWDQACNASQDGNVVVLVGWDGGYDGLWLWLKPGTAAGVPNAHRAQLKLASELLLVAGTDSDDYVGMYNCSEKGHQTNNGVLYIHSSLQAAAKSNLSYVAKVTALYNQAAPFPPLPSGVTGDTLRQWEWGLPTQTIQAYRDVWQSLNKPANTVTVLQGDVVSGYTSTPCVWEKYLQRNNVTPRGVTVYSYWIGTPALDRCDRTLPIPAYAFWKPNYHPIYDVAKALLLSMVHTLGATTTALHTRLFVNNVGSTTDVPQGVELLMNQTQLSAKGVWVSNGYDVPEIKCVNLANNQVPCAHEVAALVLQNLTSTPQPTWCPLTVFDVVNATLTCAPSWHAV